MSRITSSIRAPIDLNAIAPLTDWTPTANNGSPGPVAKFLDPTSANGGTGGFYSPNLIRALAGPYPGWGGIQMYTQNGESYYDSLQAQFNKRVGKRFHFGSNYTWSKTLVYSRDAVCLRQASQEHRRRHPSASGQHQLGVCRSRGQQPLEQQPSRSR